VTAAAPLAREAAVMRQSLRLANWLAQSPRRVTAGQVLRPADVAVAGAALGVDVPTRVRTSADVPALHRPWTVAVATGLVTIDTGMATAGPALSGQPDVADAELLGGWLSGLRAVCQAESSPDRPEGVAVLVFTVLKLMTLDEPPSGHDLWRLAYTTIVHDDDLYDRFDRRVIDRYGDPGIGEPLAGLFTLLASFGTTTGTSPDARITPLGRWAVQAMNSEKPPPISADLSADELIARLGLIRESSQILIAARPWLMGRSSLAAARELLTAAEHATAAARLAAIEVVSILGEPVFSVWQEMVDTPRVGPHARAASAAWDAPELAESDRRRIVVDTALAELTRTGPDDALSCVYEMFSGPDLQSRIALVADSDHPDAGALAQALTTFVDSGAPRTADQVLQLNVTLKGTQPPISRRVLVRATADLEDLHLIIQVLFGWDGDHLHVFEVGGQRYTDPYFELEDPAVRSEFDLRLAAAFTPSVRKIKYTYDFGACWRHEITLEKVVERTPGQDNPVCIAFKGDSPMEYWSEGDPQDQGPFDLAAVNQRLARRHGDDDQDDDDEGI